MENEGVGIRLKMAVGVEKGRQGERRGGKCCGHAVVEGRGDLVWV